MLSNTASKKSGVKQFVASVELETGCPCDTWCELDLILLSLYFQIPSVSPASVFIPGQLSLLPHLFSPDGTEGEEGENKYDLEQSTG